VLEQGATTVKAYFPAGYWYDLTAYFSSDGSNILAVDSSQSGGLYLTLSTQLNQANVHLRGGQILPLQKFAMTTVSARATPFTLLVALDNKNVAAGSLFWDDGEQIDLHQYLECGYHASLGANSGIVKNTDLHRHATYDDASTYLLDTIHVLGSQLGKPKAVRMVVNGNVLADKSVSINVISDAWLEFQIVGFDLTIADEFELRWVF
jgi:hypothetical protein